jgi:hypothetical protein
MPNTDYREAKYELSAAACDMHKAIISLTKELATVDWYEQRADTCENKELKAVLIHNRDAEQQHASSMLLEWIRHNDSKLSGELKDCLIAK